jgi:hypothetical protein
MGKEDIILRYPEYAMKKSYRAPRVAEQERGMIVGREYT